ncbi:MAG: aldo/keto reductase [Coriobacteriales bacterium]|nr:aldo/keto reductase [Coriobacteriales bacterium]
MQYRTLGNTGVEVSALGMGAMRLPTLDGMTSSANIDIPRAVALTRAAIDGGVNYVDTAYVYHQQKSEGVVARALASGYRDKVQIATKLPMALVAETADFDRILNEQLTRLQTDHVDFYLFHGIGAETWEKIQRLDLISTAEKARDLGKIGHICFSFHDSYEAFETIINGYDGWSMAQIMYNYMDEDNQAGRKGVELAVSKGIGVVIMEPLRGGKLSRPIPAVQALLDAEGYTAGFAELALRWVWDQAGIGTALSGMTTLEQLEQNLDSADKGVTGGLSDFEHQLIDRIREVYREQSGIPCTACGYCMPCPQGCNIPSAFNLYNEAVIYQYDVESQRVYNLFSNASAADCIQCGVCEEKCPQKIEISEWMPEIHKKFAN